MGILGERLIDRFDARANGLNMLRLALAVLVILWHSFPLTGRTVEAWPAMQLLSEFGVDGFFAISGFLIYRSWMHQPRVGAFLRARVLRIFPAYWACLVLTAFVIAPFGLLLQGANLATFFSGLGPVKYVTEKLLLWNTSFDINGTPSGVPFPNAWNGSLWTLRWEFGCYLAVILLGVLGLFARKWLLPTLFATLTFLALIDAVIGIDIPLAPVAVRFALMFVVGMLLYEVRHRIRVSGALVALSAMVIAIAGFLPDYRVVAAFPIAYFLIGLATYIQHPKAQMKTDISYGMYIYAFPIQQVLALAGLSMLPVLVFWSLATAITSVFAFGSWMLIERNALKLKGRPAKVAAVVA